MKNNQTMTIELEAEIEDIRQQEIVELIELIATFSDEEIKEFKRRLIELVSCRA